MMASLLSIFDPTSSTPMSNWFISLLFFMMFPLDKFWLLSSIAMNPVKYMTFFMIPDKMAIFFTPLFKFYIVINFMGLIPYSFSMSSHFMFNFSLAFPLWISFVMWGLIKMTKYNLAHLTPLGCPIIIVPFMVLVETVSSSIRPITLSLRLMSNMMAGHMILHLLASSVSLFTLPFFLMEILFFTVELGVAVIQTYVFTSLTLLYWYEYSGENK